MRSKTSDAATLLAMKAKGVSHADICSAFGVDAVELREMLRDAAADLRRRLADVAEERALVADARIEWMLEKLMRLIGSDPFDDRKWKVAIALLERQAKMFGIDRARESAGDMRTKSFADMPPAKLREYADEIGLQLPDTFSAGE